MSRLTGTFAPGPRSDSVDIGEHALSRIRHSQSGSDHHHGGRAAARGLLGRRSSAKGWGQVVARYRDSTAAVVQGSFGEDGSCSPTFTPKRRRVGATAWPSQRRPVRAMPMQPGSSTRPSIARCCRAIDASLIGVSVAPR